MSEQNAALSRRNVLRVAGTALLSGAASPLWAQAPKVPDTGGGTPIPLPPTSAPTEQAPPPPALPLPPGERVGFAVVGLGNLALEQIIPAFGESKRAKLTALVSGDRAKALEVAKANGVPDSSVYDYQSYDRLRDNPNVDVIYIVLPNSMHHEFTIRGAQAGKHILCEKPMATSPKECEDMIAACKKANVKLMIAYRIQYEPHNRYVQKMVRAQKFGPVKVIEAVNGQNQGDPNQWRHKLSLAGGGSLPDVGLYCLNTTRFLLGEEPDFVNAHIYTTPGDPRFKEVEETVQWQMTFPSGVQSNNLTSYGFHESRRYRVLSPSGWVGLDPAFAYNNLQIEQSFAEGPVERKETPVVESKNQFAQELDHMAECVKLNKTPYTPGEEGLQDHRIMTAIYESARENKPVKLPTLLTRDTFRGKDTYETLQS